MPSILVNCETCGEPFHVPLSTYNDKPQKGKGRARGRFCSEACAEASPDRPVVMRQGSRYRKLPATAEIIRLYDSGMSCREIADRYGCKSSDSVQKHIAGAKHPMHGRWGTEKYLSLPTDKIVALYESGETLPSIALKYDVSTNAIAARLETAHVKRRRSIYGGHGLHRCVDGHVVRSRYEMLVDDWLWEHDIAHAYEPRLPFDSSKTQSANFLARGIYIEVWGITQNGGYDERRRAKVSAYEAAGLRLLQLFGRDVEQHIDTILAPLLEVGTNSS